MIEMSAHRCFVPDCDNSKFPVYNEPWTKNAIPTTATNELAQCEMFDRVPIENHTLFQSECPAEWFSSQSIKCNNWIFDSNERTIVNDVRIIGLYPKYLREFFKRN